MNEPRASIIARIRRATRRVWFGAAAGVAAMFAIAILVPSLLNATSRGGPPPAAAVGTVSATPKSSSARASVDSADMLPAGVDAQPSIGPGWKLTPSSVGLAPFGLTCGALPVYKPPSSTLPAGAVIDERRITGPLDLSAGNITIKRSCIQPVPGAVSPGTSVLTTSDRNRRLQGPVIIEDSEYDGSLLSQHDEAWTQILTGVASYYRDYIHNSGSGMNTYGSYEKTGADVVIENNYVDHLVATGDPTSAGNHQSAYSVRDFDTSMNSSRQLVVRDNYLNCDGPSCTGGLFIQATAGDITNVTAEGNLIAGGGWQLYLDYQPVRFPGLSYANIRALDNRMTGGGWGPVFVRAGGAGFAQWTDNYLYDPNGVGGEGNKLPDPS